MTLSLTPTLGVIGAIILILFHVAISFLFPPFFSVLSLQHWLADQLTASVAINCTFARCFGTEEQLLGDLLADVTENSCIETLIPWQLFTWLCSVAFFFVLHLSLLMTFFHTTSASYSPQWSVSVHFSVTLTQCGFTIEIWKDSLAEAS